MTITQSPVPCGMPGCACPVENPSKAYISISLDHSTIQIPICKTCQAQLLATKRNGFGRQSLN